MLAVLTVGVGYGGEVLLLCLMGHDYVDGETEAQTYGRTSEMPLREMPGRGDQP